MPLYFAGQIFITPVTVSTVDDSALADTALATGNIVVIAGASAGGRPKTPLAFSGPAAAQAALVSGELCDAVTRAFAPSSDTGGPSAVIAMRVNPALQAALVLDAGGIPVIALNATDYGQRTNGIKVRVESGSVSGKLLTTQLGTNYYTQDNVSRGAVSVGYTGAGTNPTVAATPTTVTLTVGGAATAIDLTILNSVSDLADRINAVAGFEATILDSAGAYPVNNAIDTLAATAIPAGGVVQIRADLQACIDWFNGNTEGFVDATRSANAGHPPDNIAFTYLTGGTDGVITNSDWNDVLTALTLVDLQNLCLLTPDPAVHAMGEAHVQYMSLQGRRERRLYVGLGLGTTIAEVVAAAYALDCDRVAEVYPGYYAFNAAGQPTLYPPYMTAALIAAMFSAVDPGTPLTNKSLAVQGLEVQLMNPTDTDVLITGGVLAIEDTGKGFKVVQSCSTWTENENFNRVEISTGIALDYASRSVRDALDVLRGSRGDPRLIGRAITIATTTLNELSTLPPNGPGVLVGDAASPPWKNLQVNLNGNILAVSFQGSPVIPANYIPVTIYAVPFSSTATSAGS